MFVRRILIGKYTSPPYRGGGNINRCNFEEKIRKGNIKSEKRERQ
jgi:hypothetical protein